ncbi:alkaline phosphatase D family protein [Pseudonocardia spinosispora]|uniref:alkaline phosphatase D family protein n=1 Tax=Pseudonocardia spinosispora TaxID=103441 RepID=UPI00040148A8|nr:alkaline phosphatase D family protein [Pseudonocardia spinosispora]
MSHHISRRTVLRGGVTSALLLGAAACSGPARPPAARAAAPVFTLGVASGDPTPDGMVLWTRLARDPVHPDGLGGMPNGTVDVDWELAADERFAQVLQRGTARTGPELGYAVHVEPVGLPPDREFWYRFKTGGELSPVGRTRTAPPATALTPMTLCFVSCARYDQGLFTAYRRLAEDRPDLVLHLGDYSYEYASTEKSVRQLAGGVEHTLADYRRRYAQYHADPDLQAAHAVAPWAVVNDDHEIENNWADMIPEHPDEQGFAQRRVAAYQAYYENVPLRVSARPTGTAMRLYRRIGWGGLASFHMLDTRQYRGDQPCGDHYDSDCPERTDPARSLMGAEQEAWLQDGFARSTARWDVLGQQVFFSQCDLTPGAARGFNPDAWDGYVGCRDRVVDGWVRSTVRNPVVLSGDVHNHWAAEVKTRFDDPASPVVGTELVATSIASGGDGSETESDTAAVLAENPHVKFFNNRRGYVRARITPDTMTADFRVVPYVSKPDAPGETRATFVIEDRQAGLHKA